MQQGQNSTLSANGIIYICVKDVLLSSHACFLLFYDSVGCSAGQCCWSEQDYRVTDCFTIKVKLCDIIIIINLIVL